MGALGRCRDSHNGPDPDPDPDPSWPAESDTGTRTMSSYIRPLSATCIVVTFALLLYWEHQSKAEMPMREIAGRAASAGGFAPALFLMYGSFNISALCNWSG